MPRAPGGEVAKSFAIRFDKELGPGAILLSVESEAGRWYEVPFGHGETLALIDKLTRLASRFQGGSSSLRPD